MAKTDDKRREMAEAVADFLLANGLGAASLRPLAAAAGTSDRMLLYYFRSKEEIITAALEHAAARLAARLVELSGGKERAPAVLERELIALTAGPIFWPFMCLWLEIAALAARGDPLYQAVGRKIALGFEQWIGSQLALEKNEDRRGRARHLLRAVEGAVLLRGMGLPDPSSPRRGPRR